MADVKYDAELCERLEREAREDRPDVKEWAGWVDDNLDTMADQLAAARAEIERLTAERDLENRMLDKLIVAERDRLSAELALMRPVVLAAELEVDRHSSCVIAERARDPLACAVDEYRAARGKAVR